MTKNQAAADQTEAANLVRIHAEIVAQFAAGTIDGRMLDLGLRSTFRRARSLSKAARETFNVGIRA